MSPTPWDPGIALKLLLVPLTGSNTAQSMDHRGKIDESRPQKVDATRPAAEETLVGNCPEDKIYGESGRVGTGCKCDCVESVNVTIHSVLSTHGIQTGADSRWFISLESLPASGEKEYVVELRMMNSIYFIMLLHSLFGLERMLVGGAILFWEVGRSGKMKTDGRGATVLVSPFYTAFLRSIVSFPNLPLPV